jgi:hypothetical protein
MTIGGGTLLSDRFGNVIARRPTHGRRVCFPRGSRAAPEPPSGRGASGAGPEDEPAEQPP